MCIRDSRNTRTKWEKKDPENGRYMWDFSVIKDLLMNPVYTGAIASQKKDLSLIHIWVRQGVGEPNRIYVLIPGKEDAALA